MIYFYGLYTVVVGGVPAAIKFLSEHFDSLTFGLAAVLVPIKASIRYIIGRQPCANSKICGEDFLNGILLVPFFALSVTIFFPELFVEIAEHPAEVSIAGAIALFVGIEKIVNL